MDDTNREILNEEKKKLFENYLVSMDKQREHKLQKKKKEDFEKKNPEEHMLFIQKQFKAKSQSLQAIIKKYKAKQEAFEPMFEEYSALKEYYVGLCYALKTYDRQFYKEALDKFYNTIMDLKKKNQPVKKFKFKRRDQDFGVKNNLEEEAVIVIKEAKQHNIPGIKGKNNENLIIREGWSNLGSYKIVECENTTIELQDKTQILFLKKLTNCVIKTALTKSTVFVDECKNCKFEINCHQLRIHNTFQTTFGIFVTSKAIIEDCKQIKFTPYSFQYEGRQNDEVQLERAGKQNLWREIQDFNWLKQNQASPHYSLIEP